MRNLFIGIITFALLSLAASAQTRKFSNKDHGYSFTAPEGWTAVSEEGKCPSVTLTNAEQTVSIIVAASHTTSLGEYFRSEYKVLDFGFIPQGRVQENNGLQGLRLLKYENGKQSALDSFLKPLGENDAVTVMALIESPEYSEEAYTAILQIFKSIKLSFSRKLKNGLMAVEKDLAAQNGKQSSQDPISVENQNSEWGRFLSGKKLETFKNGSSRVYRLCGSGRFSSGSQTLNSSQNGSVTLASNNSGRWSVQGNTLTLRYGDGDVVTFELSPGDARSIKLDGTGYLVEEADCS